jgi:hypothetical protein
MLEKLNKCLSDNYEIDNLVNEQASMLEKLMKCVKNNSKIDHLVNEQAKKIKNNEWEDLIFLPYHKGKNKEENIFILDLKREDLVKQLSVFFRDRFEIKEDLTIRFENVLNKILNKEYFLLMYNDIEYNFYMLLDKYFETKEERKKQENLKLFFDSLAYELKKEESKKEKVWREMSVILKEEFKNIKIKNINKKTKFLGCDLPNAAIGGFEERMEYENIRYSIEEQGRKVKEDIFCTTSVYIMSIIEIKQGLLFRKYGMELLENMSLENLILFKNNLNELKNMSNIL